MQVVTKNNQNFENRLGTHPIENYFDSSHKKFGYAYAQSTRKCSSIEILAKIKGKESKFLFKN